MIKTQKLLLVLLIFCANSTIFAAPPLEAIQKAKSVVEDARYMLPMEAGYGIMLTQLDYDSKTYSLVYRYHYTLPTTKPTATAIREVKLGIIHLLKAQPDSDEMRLLRSGITFYYNYYSSDGSFLYATKITPADIK